MTEDENTESRPLASYETSFWAFLEYPAFWIPVLGFTVVMLIVVTVLMILGTR